MTVQREAVWTLVLPATLVGPGSAGWPARWALSRILDRGRRRRLAFGRADDVIGWAITGHAAATAAWAPAPVCWSGDFGTDPPLGVVRIDPVRLVPGPRGLTVAPPGELEFRPGESERLGAAVAEALAARAIRVRVAAPDRWYMTLADAPAEAWLAPEEAAGRSVLDGLPAGEDAEELRSVLNEIQMVLHQQPDNARRRERGEPEVNSVWPWGWTARPLPRVESVVDQVFANHAYGRGLARLAGLEPKDGSRRPETLARAGVVVPTAHRGGDPEWLESTWCRPLLRALAKGRVERLRLATLSGEICELDNRDRRRFWRRGRRSA